MRRVFLVILVLATACSGTHAMPALPSPSSSPSTSASSAAEPQTLVPDVVGQVFDSAKASLESVGLTVTGRTRVTQAAATGTVLSQSPAAGQAVTPGSTVILVVAKETRIPAGVRCPTNPLRGVYHPYRLAVLKTCQWFVGTVVAVRPEADGDHHIDITPDKGYGKFLDAGDRNRQHGGLLIEIMPGQKLTIPFVGEHVSVFGTWVYDTDHGWNEFHPAWAMDYLDTGKLVVALPPTPPRFNPDAGGSSGGGGGSTNCDPSYPTVCIPPPPPDLNCGDISYRNFTVLPPDPHHFDGDHDGIGCET